MNKRTEVLLLIVAGASLTMSILALYRKADERKVLNETYTLLHKLNTETDFFNIVEHYGDGEN
jgi:hypothetical protein